MADRLLDRQRLLDAFQMLAAKLARRGVVGEVHVFGGAAMVLVFDERAATRDVDAIFEPDGPMLDAALEVAHELDLPRSWLNNQASTYVSGRAGRGTPAFDQPNLRVLTTPAEHLLAMKVRASRSARDAEDIRLLLHHLDIHAVDDVVAVVSRYFPDDPLSDRSRMLIEDLLL
ncbi:hypothetical protein BH23ACT9_BH23ACT9_29520 [soil metagenome]